MSGVLWQREQVECVGWLRQEQSYLMVPQSFVPHLSSPSPSFQNFAGGWTVSEEGKTLGATEWLEVISHVSSGPRLPGKEVVLNA